MSFQALTLIALVITLLLLNYCINKYRAAISELCLDNGRMGNMLFQVRRDVFMRYMKAENAADLCKSINDLIAVETALYGQSASFGYWYGNRETLRANFELWGSL